MSQIILDTNAFRYFYQIECCGGEGVSNKVLGKYSFDKEKYVDFLRSVDSICIPYTTRYELFFQAFRKNEGNLLLAYNDLTQRYKTEYNVDVYSLNPCDKELRYDERQLARDFARGVIQKEKYVLPRIKYEVRLMSVYFSILIGILVDVLYGETPVDQVVCNKIFGESSVEREKKLYKLYIDYYINDSLRMTLKDIDEKLDGILLESIRGILSRINEVIACPRRELTVADILYKASNTSEYLTEILCGGSIQMRDDFERSVDNTLKELAMQKDVSESEVLYWKHLLKNALNGAKCIVHKNDMMDYGVITMLNENVTLKVLEGHGKKEEMKLITFDKRIFEFSKLNNVMYDEEIYKFFLTEIVK